MKHIFTEIWRWLANLDASAQIALVMGVSGLLAGAWRLAVWYRRKRRIGTKGRTELREIYREAARTTAEDYAIREAMYAVIDLPAFFDRAAEKEYVGREAEFDVFRKQLSEALPDKPADEIGRLTESLYAEIVQGLEHAEYPAWNRRAQKWLGEIDSNHPRNETEQDAKPGTVAHDRVGLHRIQGYMRISVTEDSSVAANAKADAQAYFGQHGIGIPEIPRSAVEFIGHETTSVWEDTLAAANKSLGLAKRKGHEVHLVCVARSLWCYALGVQIQVNHPLVIYHYQDGDYHRIWKINRKIKDLKAPLDDRDYTYRVCGEPRLVHDGSNSKAVILGLAIGSHREIKTAFEAFRVEHLPDVPMWEMKRRDVLSPTVPEDWIDAATDMTYALDHLSSGGSKEVYLFGIMPAVLGLMFGSAVGPYRHVHLLQFDGRSYVEMLELQPRRISATEPNTG